MKKGKYVANTEFFITCPSGFQYIVNNAIREIINDGEMPKPVELDRWQESNGLDVVIEIRTEEHKEKE